MAFDAQGFRKAALKAGYKPAEVDKIVNRYATQELGKQGVLDTADIAKTDPQTALSLTQQGIKPKATGDTKETAALRKEFAQEAQKVGFKEIQNSWNKVQSAGKTGAGDLTVLYSYIKALDPESVVREGEINLLKAAESVPGNVITAYKRAKEGKAISDELRQELTTEIGHLYNDKAKQQKELNAFYSGLASDMGADPHNVVGGVGEVKMLDLPETPAGKKQQEGATGWVGAGAEAGKGVLDFLLGNTLKAPGRIAEMSQQQAARPPVQNFGEAVGRAGQDTLGLFGITAPAAVEVGGLRGAGGVLKSGVGGAKNLITKGPGGILAEKRAAAQAAADAAGVRINPQAAIQSAQQYVDDVPMAGDALQEMLPTLAKQGGLTVEETLNKLSNIGKLTYSKGGDPKSTAQAQLFNKLYGGLRGELSEQAPDVAKFQSLLHMTKDLPKQASSKGWQALKFTALGKLLGL